MYIIQIADLHMGSEIETKPSEEELIKESTALIKKSIPKNEVILLSICGDVIDSKGLGDDKPEVTRRYDTALKLIDTFRHLLEDDYTIHIGCCPGNHDITHVEELHDFVNKLGTSKNISKTQLKSCYDYRIGNSHFVFVNSCKGNQHDVGRIEYDALEQTLGRLPQEDGKVLILHHAIMSMYEEDPSSIRNAARLVGILEKYNISAVLHGHIHGREILSLGRNQCRVIGIGALFSRNNVNVNSQFNILRYNGSEITEVLNCRFNQDGGSEPWDVCDLTEASYENIFSGKSFRDVYTPLINRLEGMTPLYNVVLEIKSDYQGFVNTLKQFLKDDYIRIGDKQYSYFELAEKWEANEVPEDLYFNHGSYFSVDGKAGIDFVKEKLYRKATSNRIVLSTYNTRDVVQSFDDSRYLPSLESIQFGMIEQDRQLIVHMRFRALEAGRFLKINICEIAYILRELRKRPDPVSFDKVDITISAFRVQKKERFNCFLKAEIDKLPRADLDAKVNHGKIEEVCRLLTEKRDAMDTITKIQGIETVYLAMKASNKEAGENTPIYYSDSVIKLFEEVLEVYKELDDIHARQSIRSKEEKDCENKIDVLLGNIIQKLKENNDKRKENI